MSVWVEDVVGNFLVNLEGLGSIVDEMVFIFVMDVILIVGFVIEIMVVFFWIVVIDNVDVVVYCVMDGDVVLMEVNIVSVMVINFDVWMYYIF